MAQVGADTTYRLISHQGPVSLCRNTGRRCRGGRSTVLRMRPRVWTLSLALPLLVSASACDKGDAKSDAKSEAKTDDSKKTPEVSAKTPDPEAKPEPAAVHFDIEKDKSMILARTASTLATSERISTDNPLLTHITELSHHAGDGPSNEALCAEVIELRSSVPAATCVITLEHERVLLGPEVFAQMAACIQAATSEAELAACEAAEKHAEILLHEKAHGDGLSPEVCTSLFDHFEKLAMDDAGDQAEIVKEILEEVREDVVTACQDQGSQAEIDCAMAAKDMATLGLCRSTLL
jgi:hypothetical protein